MTEPDVLLTVKEYATLFGIHPTSVYTAIREQRLRYPVEYPTGSRFQLIRLPRTLYERLSSSALSHTST